MRRYPIMVCGVLAASVFFVVFYGWWSSRGPKVVVYCSLDRNFSEPIFDAFTKETGIRVLPKYDPESSKTVQLTTRILVESRKRTRCDVFWNNEILNTLRLDGEQLLDRYQPTQAGSFPSEYQSTQGRWHGFAARARVLLVNKDVVKPDQMPSSIYDLHDPRWKGKVGMAKPLFGTTASHAVCLFEALGEERAQAFFEGLKENEIQVLSGNKQVAEDVSQAKIAFGLTDTDDAMVEISNGHNVVIVYPDSQPGQLGTLFIPNTLAVLRGAPHAEHARRLVDYVLSAEVETKLAQGLSAQIPLHQDVHLDLRVESPATIQAMEVDFEAAVRRWEAVGTYLKERFLETP